VTPIPYARASTWASRRAPSGHSDIAAMMTIQAHATLDEKHGAQEAGRRPRLTR
jgi:hypothetical protein